MSPETAAAQIMLIMILFVPIIIYATDHFLKWIVTEDRLFRKQKIEIKDSYRNALYSVATKNDDFTHIRYYLYPGDRVEHADPILQKFFGKGEVVEYE